MTARVMLNLDEGQQVDAEWLAELLAWDLSAVAGVQQHARCVGLVAMVASRHGAAATEGPSAWPTLEQLASWLRVPEHANGLSFDGDLMRLVTVAVAAGWLVYADDGTAQ
jgi:hypothetical protein